MKPELSRAATGSLPSRRTKAMARATVSGLVRTLRTTSTSGISGTGLKKCSPITRSARAVAAANAAIVRLDVLEAKIVAGPTCGSSSRNSAVLSDRSSVIASMMRPAGASAASSVVNCSCSSAAAWSAVASFPFSTSFASDLAMPAFPRPIAASSVSRTTV